GDLDRQPLVVLDESRPVAGGARRDDDLASAAAMRAALLHREDAALHAHLAVAATGIAGLRLAIVRARAAAALAADAGGIADFLFDAEDGFFEIQFDHVTQVGTATRLAAATTATAKDVSKDVAENITQVVEALAAAVAAVVPGDAIVAVLVVALALARITKDLVGLLDFLEALFSLRIIGIAVGMAFHGVPAEGLLQVRFAHR